MTTLFLMYLLLRKQSHFSGDASYQNEKYVQTAANQALDLNKVICYNYYNFYKFNYFYYYMNSNVLPGVHKGSVQP